MITKMDLEEISASFASATLHEPKETYLDIKLSTMASIKYKNTFDCMVAVKCVDSLFEYRQVRHALGVRRFGIYKLPLFNDTVGLYTLKLDMVTKDITMRPEYVGIVFDADDETLDKILEHGECLEAIAYPEPVTRGTVAECVEEISLAYSEAFDIFTEFGTERAKPIPMMLGCHTFPRYSHIETIREFKKFFRKK